MKGVQNISKINLIPFLNDFNLKEPEIISTFFSDENSFLNVVFCCPEQKNLNGIYLIAIDSSSLHKYKLEITVK